MEPIKWTQERKGAFTRWMTNEIQQTEGDRARLERKWQDLIIRLRARVLGNGTADVPFVGASDLEYPLAAIHYEPVYADLMQTLHVPRNFWSVTPMRSDTVGRAKPWQEFLGIIEREELDMREVNTKAFIDLVGLGTCVLKDYILHDRKSVKDYDETGQIIKKTKLNFRPQVKHIPLQDFWFPAYGWRVDPDAVGGCPWVAHRFELTKSQFRQRAKAESPFQPDYDSKAVERVLMGEVDDPERIRNEQRKEDSYVPFQDRKIRLFEIWARFDVDNDGIDEDVVVVWHQPSGTILRATYNPFLHGERPFEVIPYIPGPGMLGMGIVEADEWAQIAMSKILNSALDNALIGNSRMYGVPQGMNISPDEPIHGGKVWQLAPGEQITEVRMGDVNPGIFQLMDRFQQWSESRTGVSELRQGNLSNLPGRTPAATVMSVLSEGTKKFDMVLASLRSSYSRIGKRVMQNLLQISKTDMRYKQMAIQMLGPEEGVIVAEILDMPIHAIEELYGVSVTATSSQVNKEVEKQSVTALAQFAAQFYPQLVQYAQALAQSGGDPQILMSTIEKAYTGQVELFKRLLETFDIQNPEEYLPVMADPQAQAPQQQGMMGAPGMAGAPGGGGPVPPAFNPAAQGGDVLSQFLGL